MYSRNPTPNPESRKSFRILRAHLPPEAQEQAKKRVVTILRRYERLRHSDIAWAAALSLGFWFIGLPVLFVLGYLLLVGVLLLGG